MFEDILIESLKLKLAVSSEDGNLIWREVPGRGARLGTTTERLPETSGLVVERHNFLILSDVVPTPGSRLVWKRVEYEINTTRVIRDFDGKTLCYRCTCGG